MSSISAKGNNLVLLRTTRALASDGTIGISKELTDTGLREELFLISVKFTQGRYKVNLPWLRDKSEVPDHYNLCFNRLKTLQRRLAKEPDILIEYQALIKEQLNLGITEPVGNSLPQESCVHYLPHHPVVKQNRSTTCDAYKLGQTLFLSYLM